MNHLFSMEGPLMRALSDLTTLVILNLLTLLCSIPIVTAGAALTTLHYCVMKMLEGEGHLGRRYFSVFKDNLKGSIPVWFAFLAAAGSVYLDFRIFGEGEVGKFKFALLPAYIIIIILAALFVWVFPLLARIENPFLATIKNAAIMAVGYLPRTLAMMVIYAVAVFVFTQEMRLLPIAFVLGLSLPSYLCALIYNTPIKNVIANMQGGGNTKDDPDNDPEGKGES